MKRLLHSEDGPFSKMMAEVGEFERDVARPMRYSNVLDSFGNFASPTSFRNEERTVDRRLKAYFCKEEECLVFWRLDPWKLKLTEMNKPNCVACTNADYMEEFVGNDYAMLYRYECKSCQGPVMSSSPNFYSNWKCCYCNARGRFENRTG